LPVCSKKISSSAVSTAAIALVLTGCAVGPDFKKPVAPPVSSYTREPLSGVTANADIPSGGAQNFIAGEGISAQWWALFQSPQLNALIEQAIKNSPTLQAAEASLRVAQETQRAKVSILFPAIDDHVNATRQKNYSNFGGSGGATTISPYTVTTASVSVSYAIDLWGGSRHALESTKAQTEQARFQLEAAYLALTSNIIITAVQQAALHAQFDATQAILNAQNEQLGLLRLQLDLGGVAEADVLTQVAVVAQTRAQLPALQKQLSQINNQLLALTGRFPDDASLESFDLTTLKLPENLPVSLPSELVQQRPDIRTAEAIMHSASADVGVATALMLPQISLNASYGNSASRFSDLLNPGSTIWNLGAGLTQPLFRGGELLHQRHAAKAAYDRAAAQYRGTVIAAFQNVADTLLALKVDAESVSAQLAAERASSQNLEIAQNRFQSGATSLLTLLDAQRTYQQARVALIQAQANRYADTAALFVALGGGWWNRQEEKVTSSFRLID
jgi:NodT family efflux transporter outer membrane factor (OMF) lipoprotein